MGTARPSPDLRLERDLASDALVLIAGCDEVGRGALAGPVSVGMVVIDVRTVGEPPRGLRDSKLLTPRQRHELQDPIRSWAQAFGVGHASAEEVDCRGLTAALRVAGYRAMKQMGVRPDRVILDGRHDWLTTSPQTGWLDEAEPMLDIPPVVTRVGADRLCATVAAASVLAKVERDRLMASLGDIFPAYCWQDNKGYGSEAHLDALRRLGPTEYHRRSWRLPGSDSASVTSHRTSGS